MPPLELPLANWDSFSVNPALIEMVGIGPVQNEDNSVSKAIVIRLASGRHYFWQDNMKERLAEILTAMGKPSSELDALWYQAWESKDGDDDGHMIG